MVQSCWSHPSSSTPFPIVFPNWSWKDQGIDETQEGEGETMKCGIFLCWFSIQRRLGSETGLRVRNNSDPILISSLFPYPPVNPSLMFASQSCLLSHYYLKHCSSCITLITIDQPGNRAKEHKSTIWSLTSNPKDVNKSIKFSDTFKKQSPI